MTSPAGYIWVGGLIKSSTAAIVQNEVMQGTACTSPKVSFQGNGQTPCYAKIRSTVWQTTQLVLASAVLHVDGDLGQFDLAAAQTGISVNGTFIGEGSTVHFNSGQHYGGATTAPRTCGASALAPTSLTRLARLLR